MRTHLRERRFGCGGGRFWPMGRRNRAATGAPAAYRAPMTEFVLHYAPDNASLIVRLILEEMGQPYDTRLVDRRTGAQHGAAYRRLNPAGHIPALETPEGPISETGAIVLWLADRHGNMAPAPTDPARGVFLKWLFFLSNTLQPSLRMTFYPEKYIGGDVAGKASMRQHMQAALAEHLQLLEQAAKGDHAWFGGEAVSVFDYYLACCLRWCALYPEQKTDWFRLADYPRLHRMAVGVEGRPAVKMAQMAEGLGPHPFSAPVLARPPEGSAL